MSRNIKRVSSMLEAINNVGRTSNGQERLAYTEEEDRVFDLIAKWCEYQGMTIRKDYAGNLIARRPGMNNELPAVAVGSHLDTVYTGGKYDGTVGVVTGVEVVTRLNEQQVETEHPVEVIVFRAEESSRFGVATIGSKAMAGKIDTALMDSLKDREGVSFQQATRAKGVFPARMNESKRTGQDLAAFFEVHIEQGLELESTGKAIAIATAIAAPTRLSITVEGKYSHSGTTAMDKRQDALVYASRLVLAINQAAREEAKHGTVATVGVLNVENGAMNVVPGKVNMKVDIRGIDTASIARVNERIQSFSTQLETDGARAVLIDEISSETPVPLSEELVGILGQAASALHLDTLHIPSGAGHDAMNMAAVTESALIFIPSKDGLSHHPDEHSDIEDIVTACDVIEEAVKLKAKAGVKELEDQ